MRLISGPLRGWSTATLCCVVVLAGCSARGSARSALQSGRPIEAVALYERALQDSPSDLALRRELDAARVAAGGAFAVRAEDALRANDYEQAVRLAQQAVQYDRGYRTLEERARHALADEHLQNARGALASDRFGEARRTAEAARASAPDLNAPLATLAQIDAAESASLAERAMLHVQRHEFESAVRAVGQARALQPDNDALRELQAVVHLRARESTFDALAERAAADLEERRVHAFAMLEPELTALDVRPERLAELRAEHERLRSLARKEQAQARAARNEQRFDDALHHAQRAMTLATDDVALQRELAAAEAQALAAADLHEARRAFDRGAFAEAAALYRAVLAVRADAEIERELRSAQSAFHRQLYHAELADDDLPNAIIHLDALLTLERDAELAGVREQLRSELGEQAQREAVQQHAEGKTSLALKSLERAMTHVADLALRELHAELSAERLLQRAAEADARGRYDDARELYLQAMAAGIDRVALEARIDDVSQLQDMERAMQSAIADANAAEAALRDGERIIAELESQLIACDREVNRLELFAGSLSHDLHREHDLVEHLERDVRDLKREIDRLRDALRDARADADRWRRRAERPHQ